MIDAKIFFRYVYGLLVALFGLTAIALYALPWSTPMGSCVKQCVQPCVVQCAQLQGAGCGRCCACISGYSPTINVNSTGGIEKTDLKKEFLDKIFGCKNAEEIKLAGKKIYFDTGSCILLKNKITGEGECVSKGVEAWVANPAYCKQNPGKSRQIEIGPYIKILNAKIGERLRERAGKTPGEKLGGNDSGYVLIIGAASNADNPHPTDNFRLAAERAKAVKMALTATIDEKRIRAESIGDMFGEYPADKNFPTDGHENRCADRRVDVYVCD